MTAPTGPFLYDDGPAPLHTGTPRNRQGWLIGTLVAIVLLAVGMAGALLLVKGSPGEQAGEATGVFLAALADGDTETAHELLCEDERARIAPEDVAGTYLGSGEGEVVGAESDPVEGDKVQRVDVRWADGGSSTFSVISEDGPRICGVD
ncbi:hypothetical protein [Blastococcus sp. CCUG 61487]|uniref:Rv0361 family membrane protein n=1 Tax=Blastococcus sp. CCUG 61487 TaxID=1840703 RepID=UPI0010BF93B7|nr:hypothetical protein [Blastococcus sp. CCUG 61487]TKJ16788.1 hypothetical protein A6V29_12890 [Blastococcus sp. CCUG 61487]